MLIAQQAVALSHCRRLSIRSKRGDLPANICMKSLSEHANRLSISCGVNSLAIGSRKADLRMVGTAWKDI